MSYLAHITNRSFVFEDYVWSKSPFPYTLYDFALRPSRIPLNAFISGATAGGPVSSGGRAVSAKFWAEVCPPEKIHVIRSEAGPEKIIPGKTVKDIDGQGVIDTWKEKLQDRNEPCLQIETTDGTPFDQLFALFLPLS
jgi:hypothetical protein